MKIMLNEIKNQNGKRIFEEYEELEIQEPPRPVVKLNESLREHFYGVGTRYRFLKYKELRKRGWELVKISISGKRLMFPGQTHFFVLVRHDKIKKGMTPISTMPKDISIRYNVTTRHVRLEGPGTDYNGVGPWKSY